MFWRICILRFLIEAMLVSIQGAIICRASDMRFYDLAYPAVNAIYTVHKPIEILYVSDDRDGQTRKALDQPCIFLKKDFKNSLVDFEFLNILRSDTSPLKSAIVNGDVFSVTIHGISALLAAFTPSGALSTTDASEGSKFNFLNADSNVKDQACLSLQTNRRR
jgi:hypothetical protein